MKKKAKTARYLELNLGNSSSTGQFMPAKYRPNTELEFLRALKKAALDKKLRGILVNTSGFTANQVRLWELRCALENCKAAGKKIIAYFDNADFDLYCLLSLADKIVMDSSGTLNLMGYAWERLFLKESLEKLGVGFRELRYMDFKSANETFSRTSISEADREQYGAYLDEIFSLTKDTIIRNRNLNEDDFNSLLNEGFIFSPAEAKSRNLVDVLGREETLKQTIKEMEFDEPAKGNLVFISAGNPVFSLTGQKVSGYRSSRTRNPWAPQIAVVSSRGISDMEKGMKARTTSALIRELAKKSKVKALVVRIDSPGGSAVAADFIAAAVEEAKKTIPVVVSMGEMAASGGYWASMFASHICASPYTLTGSIGVISGWFFDKGFDARLGMGHEALTRGEHADLNTGIILPRRDISEEEELRFRRCILDLYDEFVKKAAEGRNMKSEDMEALARGKVYSGLGAQRLGLIDSLGGYLEALETAIKLAGIPAGKKVKIREYPKPDFFKNLLVRFSASVTATANPAIARLGSIYGYENIYRHWEDLNYRISRRGQAMPILPLLYYN